MPGAIFENTLHVEGLRDLQRAFSLVSRDLSKDLRMGLQSAAEPVRREAEILALSAISGLRRSKIPWERMRVGTPRGSVYVVPVERGVKLNARKRFRRGWDSGPPSFPQLLLGKAMEPALERNTARVEQELEDVIIDLTKAWARV